MMVTIDRLKELLAYDPESGAFTWTAPVGKKKIAGEPAGWVERCGTVSYLRIMIDGKAYMAHRLAVLYMTGAWPLSRVDHKDTNPLNNRWDNLRPATPSQNAANRGPTKRCKSGYKGVFWHKNSRKWVAYIRINYKLKNLGYYHTAEEAHEAYKRAAGAHFGDYARTE